MEERLREHPPPESVPPPAGGSIDDPVQVRAALDACEGDLRLCAAGLESFASVAAHDLRSSLGVIGGFAAVLQKRHGASLDAEGQQALQSIRSVSRRMLGKIDAWRAFSRRAVAPFHRQRVDLEALARVVTQQQAGGQAAQPPTEFRVAPLPAAYADPDLLREVLTQLVSNAVKFTRRSGSPCIELSARPDGGEAIYTVSDNGAGFDMAEVARLFRPFSRLHEESEYPGIGLGLALVSQIVQRHGGRCWAEGTPGAGARFSFTLPREPAAA